MKFKLELTIKKPLTDVWNIFDGTDNLNKWQPALKNIELISGESGQTGAVSKLTYEENEREYSLTRKILRREEHHRLDSAFAHNTDRNTFSELSPDETLWVFETEYKFKTAIMKIVGTLKKKNFVIRAQRDMERFKEFVEDI